MEGFDKQADDTSKMNFTDADAMLMKGKKSNKDTFYNPQIVVNENQLILHNHVCKSSSDKQQLKPCIEGIKYNTGSYPNEVCFDSGFSSFENESYLQSKDIASYIADQDFDKDFKEKPFHYQHFQYDPQTDCYICPKGQTLIFSRNKNYNGYQYRVYKGTTCSTCPFKSQCTQAEARTIHREARQELMNQTAYRLLTSKGHQLYNKRKHRVEPIFGHLKHNLGYTFFLLRSLTKVQAEFNLMCIAYNLTKMAKVAFHNKDSKSSNSLFKRFIQSSGVLLFNFSKNLAFSNWDFYIVLNV